MSGKVALLILSVLIGAGAGALGLYFGTDLFERDPLAGLEAEPIERVEAAAAHAQTSDQAEVIPAENRFEAVPAAQAPDGRAALRVPEEGREAGIEDTEDLPTSPSQPAETVGPTGEADIERRAAADEADPEVAKAWKPARLLARASPEAGRDVAEAIGFVPPMQTGRPAATRGEPLRQMPAIVSPEAIATDSKTETVDLPATRALAWKPSFALGAIHSTAEAGAPRRVRTIRGVGADIEEPRPTTLSRAQAETVGAQAIEAPDRQAARAADRRSPVRWKPSILVPWKPSFVAELPTPAVQDASGPDEDRLVVAVEARRPEPAAAATASVDGEGRLHAPMPGAVAAEAAPTRWKPSILVQWKPSFVAELPTPAVQDASDPDEDRFLVAVEARQSDPVAVAMAVVEDEGRLHAPMPGAVAAEPAPARLLEWKSAFVLAHASELAVDPEDDALAALPAPREAADPIPEPPLVSIDTIQFDDPDRVEITGRASPHATVRTYLNDEMLAESRSDAAGHWAVSARRELPPGRYLARAVLVDAEGVREASTEMRFDRVEVVMSEAPPIVEPAPEPEVIPETEFDLAALREETPTTVHIERGDNLWHIARAIYGEGRLYTEIYALNRNQIRNPDLIYPGQVFTVPVLDDTE